jgi:hypothetical protein
MFHLKIITKDTHADLTAIQSAVNAHPNRHFTADASSYQFPDMDVKKLLQGKCGVCIKSEDNYPKNKIQEFIQLGKQSVVLRPKNFLVSDVLNYLENGASTVVSLEDGFDVPQINKIVKKGKNQTYVVGKKLLENHLTTIINSGGSILLKNGDLRVRRIYKLLPLGEGRIYIHSGGFIRLNIDKFLKGKAIVTFGKDNSVSLSWIEEKVTAFKNQIRIESNHSEFDNAWIKKMEQLGAIII